MSFYLSEGLGTPVPEPDRLSAPFWEGLRAEQLRIQHCIACGHPQWGPEWICHICHSYDLEWRVVPPLGQVFSWTRIWHPVRASLKVDVPYLVVLVALDLSPNLRLLGNLIGPATEEPVIGAQVEGVFEHHSQAEPPFTLLQWRTVA